MAGLTAGIYALKAGCTVTLLERAARPGGLQGGWDRGGYHFEGSLHWLFGCGEPVMPIKRIYRDTGLLSDAHPVHFGDPVYGYVGEGKEVKLVRKAGALKKELLAASPEDRRAIRRLIRDIRFYFLPHRLLRLLNTSAGDYLERFSGRPVKVLLSDIVHPAHNALALIYTLSKFVTFDAGYPQGGSTRMVDNMRARFEQMGGALRTGCEALEVLLEGHGPERKVSGVRTSLGIMAADSVIVACDTVKAVDKLFSEPLQTDWARRLRLETESEQCVLVCLGVRADLSRRPEAMHCALKQAISVAGEKLSCLTVYQYAFCPGYAPEGCTALTVLIHSQSYEWWKKAREAGRYEEEKRRVIEEVSRALGEVLPEIRGRIEVSDAATPLTYERYCDTFKGGWMSIWPAGQSPRFIPARGPYKGLYFAGGRTMITGGIPIAVQSALRAVNALKKDG